MTDNVDIEELPEIIKHNYKITKPVLYQAIKQFSANVWMGALKHQENINKLAEEHRDKIIYLQNLNFYKVFDKEKYNLIKDAGFKNYKSVMENFK